MKLICPKYYKNFKCIANNCKHNCCKAGWEIDIDKKSLNTYLNEKNEFGKKLKNNISIQEKNSYFKLNNNGICPFLNSNDLCEIYINLGEKNLCQICTDHPRFYEWFAEEKECGIGLCCEEAARIILTNTSPFSTYEKNIPSEDSAKYDKALHSYLKKIRTQIFNYLNTSKKNLINKIINILNFSYTIQENIEINLLDFSRINNTKKTDSKSLKPILKYFTKFEPNDKNWIDFLNLSINKYDEIIIKFETFEKENPQINNYLKNISEYFLWRYLIKSTYDYDILSKAKFMAVSIFILKYLFCYTWLKEGTLALADCIDISRRYSEELEYSEENMEKFASDSYENEILSVKYLSNLF